MRLIASEQEILKAAIDWLNTIPDIRVWRQNTGAFSARYVNRASVAKQRFLRFGQPGQGDISGIGPDGVRIELEVKKPGETPSPLQHAWRMLMESHGAIAFWFDSQESCQEQLKAAFRDRGWTWLTRWEIPEQSVLAFAASPRPRQKRTKTARHD